jgi:tetratricopeptide (TPR) repeat protein
VNRESRSCGSCAREFEPGQEICPHCMASVTPVECRFTVETGASFQGQRQILASSSAIPDLDHIDFQPSSPFYRAFSQLRGGLLSALIAVLFTGIGGIWWVQSHRAEGREFAAVAEQAFERGHYASAMTAWESAFDAYDHGLDDQGRVGALVGLSRCHIRATNFTEALVVLQRAQKIEPDSSVMEMIRKCHRMAAVKHLERAKELFGPGTYGKSYLESELAVDGFEKGQGTDTQKAAAFRMAARCSLELEDFEGAQSYLNSAFDNEGDSKQNVALQSECDKARDAYQGQTVADIGEDGYIPQGKLDPIAIQRAAAARSPRRNRYSSNRYTSYRSSSRRSSSYRSTRANSALTQRLNNYQPRPRRVRTTVGTSASYPTHNPRRTYRQDDLPGYNIGRVTNLNNTWSGRNTSRNSAYSRRGQVHTGYPTTSTRSGYRSPSQMRLPGGYSPPVRSAAFPTNSRYR